MKSLALNLDNGRLTRWVGEPNALEAWHDRFGDSYRLSLLVYRGSGGSVQSPTVSFFIKRTRRRDATPLWTSAAFARQPTFTRSDVAHFVSDVVVDAPAFETSLNVDGSPGNDNVNAEYTGFIRVETADGVVESEFPYFLHNSGYRPAS